MKPSRSEFLDIRRLRYHFRIWGDPAAPKVFLLHGWMDSSASFQFLVNAFSQEWCAIAPDWRGYGLTDWADAETYWFPDYLGDLERILDRYSPSAPVNLVGHSMGGNVACLYAGVRPARIARLVNLEGFGLARGTPDLAPGRYARWLDELAAGASLRGHASFEALSLRLQKGNPRLTRERADFLASLWGEDLPEGGVRLRADPVHRVINPLQYQLDEVMACWRAVTAPVLWIDGADSDTRKHLHIDDADYAARLACFSNVTRHTVAHAGHMLHHDRPEEVARLIEPFLERSEG